MRIHCLAIAVSLVGCSKKDSKESTTSSAGENAPPSASAGAKAGGTDKANGFEGSLKTSGLYEATWSAAAGNAPDPFNSLNNPSLTSDKQTWANVKVELDGTIKFGSAAKELPGGTFTGSGAHVTLDKSGRFVCAFTIDTDLVGKPDSPKLHISGGMTVHWHPEGVGDMSCP